MTAARIAAGLAGPFLFLAAGDGALVLAGLPARVRGARRAALAYLAGVAAISIALWVESHVLWVTLRRSSILPVIALFALVGAIRRVSAPAPAPAPRPRRSVLHRAALVFAGVACIGVLADAIGRPVLDFDGQMTWDPAARWIRSERTVDASVFRDRAFDVHHPQYPLLLPLAQVAVAEVFGLPDDDRIVRPVYAAFLPAFLVILYGAARRFGASADGAALTVAAVAAMPMMTFSLAGGSVTTYSDFPLGAFWGAGVLLLAEARRACARVAGLLLSAALLTKSEGGPLAVVALSVFALAIARHALRRGGTLRPARGSLAALWRAALPVALAATLFLSWRSDIPNRNDEPYELGGAGALAARVAARVPATLPAIAVEMADVEAWSFFWWAALPVLLLGARTRRTRRLRSLWTALAGGVAVYLIAYAVTVWPGVSLVHPTWNRFVIQLSLPLFVIVATRLEVRPLRVSR